jgi:hypothetical protein
VLIFWPQRLVLLATPKTGTTSLEAALESLADVAVLRPPALKHTSARAYRAHLAPYLEAAAGAPFRVAALMREPGDWLASWYRARRREAEDEAEPGRGAARRGPARGAARGGPPGAGSDLADPCLASFAAFVEAHLAPAPPAAADVGTQARFLGDGAGGIAADLLFRYDRFDAFTDFLEGELGCELVLPRLNASPVRDISLPPALAARLRQARADDFALYDGLG